jgi:hypothetical protein
VKRRTALAGAAIVAIAACTMTSMGAAQAQAQAAQPRPHAAAEAPAGAAGSTAGTGAGVIGAPVAAPLVNSDFESARRGMHGNPEGWFSIQHAGDLSYTFKLDREVHHAGAASLRIDSVGPEPFGSSYQQVPAAAYRGRRMRWSGWIRTEDVRGSHTGGGAVLLMQAMQSGAPLVWNHMKDAPVTGSSDWKRYVIELDVPAAAEQLEVGVMLHGPGRMWFDDAMLEVLPR